MNFKVFSAVKNNLKKSCPDITVHPVQWLKYKKKKKMIPLNADENLEQETFSFIVDGNAKWYGHFVRQFAVPYKTKIFLP